MAINVSPLIPTENQPGYVASATTSQMNSGTDDKTFVSPLKAASTYVGYYRSTRSYAAGAVCFYGSEFWRALNTNLGVTPVEGSDWTSTTPPAASVPNATNTTYGLTRLANNTEIDSGTSDKAVTVTGLAHAASSYVKTSGDQTVAGNKTFTGDLAKSATTGEARVQAVWGGVTEPSSTYVYSTSGSGGLYDSVYGPIIYTTKGATPSVVIGGPSLTVKFRAGNIDVGSITSGGNLTTLRDSYFNGVRVGTGSYSSASGSENTAVGNGALNANNAGTGNTAVGDGALSNNTDGYNNVALGADCLLSNTTGFQNVSIGRQTLYTNTTGYNNIAVGYGVLYHNTTGVGNTAVGMSALMNNENGDNNTAVGRNALQSNVGGTDNTAIGAQALWNGPGYNECTGIGAYTFVTGNSQNQIGKIGTTTYVYDTVQSRSDQRDKADIRDTVLGLDFIKKLRPVDYKWDMRDSYRTPAPVMDSIPDGASPEEIVLIEDKYKNEILKWREQNDINNIQRDGSKKRNRYHHGVIAQEVQDIISATGVDFGGFQDHKIGGGKDVLSIGYDEFIAPLIKAVQELSAQVEELKAQLNSQ